MLQINFCQSVERLNANAAFLHKRHTMLPGDKVNPIFMPNSYRQTRQFDVHADSSPSCFWSHFTVTIANSTGTCNYPFLFFCFPKEWEWRLLKLWATTWENFVILYCIMRKSIVKVKKVFPLQKLRTYVKYCTEHFRNSICVHLFSHFQSTNRVNDHVLLRFFLLRY